MWPGCGRWSRPGRRRREAFRPVSYTHLDVYKRQEEDSVWPLLSEGFCELEGAELSEGASVGSVAGGAVAVGASVVGAAVGAGVGASVGGGVVGASVVGAVVGFTGLL